MMSSDHGSGKTERLDFRETSSNECASDSIKNKTAPSRNKCVHELFEVRLTHSDAIAVCSEPSSVTYRELDTRANPIGTLSASVRVCAEGLVGICVERSLEMIVGLLGILKAGVLISPRPSYPRERLSFMLGDGQVSVVLTQEHLREQVTARMLRRYVGWAVGTIARESDENPNNSSNTQNSGM